MSEVVIGVDAHKRSHTLVAVDAVDRKLAERTSGTASEDHLKVVEWASQWPNVQFALEDCRHVTRRLERDLLTAGLPVVRVPTHLMAGARRGGRQPGKSDPIDALAVAHAALREPGLSVARLDGPAREVKLLVDYRHTLVVQMQPATLYRDRGDGAADNVVLVEQSDVATQAQRGHFPHFNARNEFDRSVSQTLSRGLQVLEVLAAAGRPLTAQQIAESLGLSRPVVYRLLRTLAQHDLLSTEVANGLYDLGLGLLTLSRSVQKDLRRAAFPIIRSLARQIDTTAVLGLRDGDDVVYVLAAEAEFARMAVRSREGTRRPLETTTSGLALRLTFEPSPDDDEELSQARANGYAARDTVVGYEATAISAPVPTEGEPSEACVTALFPKVIDDIADKAPLVVDAARQIAGVVRI